MVHVLPGHVDRPVALVRDPAGEHLEEHDPGGVHVGARIGVPVGDQLRRHVRDRGQQLPALVGTGLDRPGQPEVGHLDHRVDQAAPPGRLGHQDVLRLDVPVHQPGPVRGGDRGEGLLQDRQRLGRGQPAPVGQQLAQGAPAYVLHHQVGQAVMAALVVDGDHVGVGQPGDGLGLVGEALQEARVTGVGRVDDLQRDRTLQPLVHGGVDGRHATPRDPATDAVAPIDERPGQCVGDGGIHREAV
jgi:hypothetical protein